jgi:DNA invertase Pin-like site-specific DNA recombinase
MQFVKDQRITDSHHKRSACIYVRQSSSKQVKQNTESQKFQLSLRERAISLGWSMPVVIDDDLGISAAGYSERPGFQKLLTQITMKQVGIIFCVDASRLSRNSKDWAQLFELCAFFDTLVADFEQIYDLNLPNDRLVLGIKGTMSEMELSILKMRLKEGAILKAKRGELKFVLPPGFIHDHNSKIVLDPNKRVQNAIRLMFSQFNAHTSVRQLLQWYKTNNVTFPVRRVGLNNPIVWEIPKYGNLSTLLQNPVYAGVYGYGRRKTISEFKDGILVKRMSNYLPYNEWKVFIKDNHEAYISWDEFLEIQKKIAQNKPRWEKDESLGAIREGLALLVGLIRCGHCGNKLYVTYKTKYNSASYFCRGNNKESEKRCLYFGTNAVDKCFSDEILKALEPFAVQSGIKALDLVESENTEKIKMAQMNLEDAKYQADRAIEQYDMADPKNRLVTSTLEDRLNVRLGELKDAKEKLDELKQSIKVLTDNEKKSILSLSSNFKAVWNHDKTDPVLKKRLIRLFIKETIVTYDPDSNLLNFVIHWNGGTHTNLSVKIRRRRKGSKTDLSLIELVKKLATRIDDAEIARVLNMNDLQTPKGYQWNKDRVINFRRAHKIKLSIKSKKDLFTSQGAKKYLNVSRNALNTLVKAGLITTNQVIEFAPWEVHKEQLDSEEVQQALKNLKQTGFLFPGKNSSKQLSLPFTQKKKEE